MGTSSSFDLICNELLVTILSFLEPHDLILTRGVSVQWKEGTDYVNFKKNPLLFTGRTKIWNCDREEFLNRMVESSIYPGIERCLDLLRCLSRSIRKPHLSAFSYFIRRVRWEHLNVEDFASLFDLLGSHWCPRMFLLLLNRYIVIHPRYMYRDLFRHLNESLYQPLLSSDHVFADLPNEYTILNRTPLFDFNEGTYCVGWKERVLSGRLDWVIGRYDNYTLDEIKMCSQEIRLRIDRYT